jgi:LAGLIDADG endonuclease
VTSIKELKNTIIPHFRKYPLQTQKAADFILIKQIVEQMSNQVHLTKEGLQQIINIRSSMNLGLSELQIGEFPKNIPVARPIIISTEIPDPN